MSPDLLTRARDALAEAAHVVVGAGAGLSDAAGLHYGGDRFREHFGDFIARYGLRDMYSAGFHPFPSPEERWGYWARHILVNRHLPPAFPLYRELLGLLEGKVFMVITTNVDHQFQKAGFPPDRIFAVQGDYGLFQCARACHTTLYDNEAAIRAMVEATVDCRMPSHLIPRCPVCGGELDANLRKDSHFVEDEAWEAARDRYAAFLGQALEGPVVFLELGVGFNTPVIIRYPFERMTYANPRATLIRLNAYDPGGAPEVAGQTLAFTQEMGAVIRALGGRP
nr:Sir2 silent information regulator family NAD-dependent deacetylase [uncultured Holophaga sp.]